jgi:putative ABC transport system substrate-binding protein
MDRRNTVFALLALGAAPRIVIAQQAAKVYRVGFLNAGAPLNPNTYQDAFVEALRVLGYVEGRNIVIERRYADGNSQRLPELAEELLRLKMDIILATSTPATLAAMKATRTTPIVMTGTLDAQEMGVVQNLAHPGGNVTGLTLISVQLIAKRLSLLKEAIPAVSRLGFLRGRPPDWAADRTDRISSTMESAAQQVGLQVKTVAVREPGEINDAIASLVAAKVDALYVLESPLLQVQRALVTGLALKARLPTVFGNRIFVDAGGLMSYGSDQRESFQRAASYVDKILKGANPGNLPIEQPTKFQLVINLKTAKSVGITIPQSMLLRADEVIE